MKITCYVILGISIVFLYTNQPLYAQDSLTHHYEKNTVYLKMSIWRTQFVQNGEQKKVGFMYRNLTNILKQSPDTHEDIRRFRKRQTISYITRFISYSLSLAAAITNHYDRDENTRILVAGDIVSFVISRLFSWSAKGTLNRAIWTYNRDVVSGKINTAGLPESNTFTIGWSYSF